MLELGLEAGFSGRPLDTYRAKVFARKAPDFILILLSVSAHLKPADPWALIVYLGVVVCSELSLGVQLRLTAVCQNPVY